MKAGGTWNEITDLSGTISDSSGKKISGSGRMLVYLPAGYSDTKKWPLIIALHGWGQKPEEWKTNTSIASLTDRHGIVIAFPDMGKSVYEWNYYPETKRQWNAIPGARWIGEVVLPFMRSHYTVYTERSMNAILGVSTGGRGAVVVSEHYPDFGFCAGISGTYDLNLLREAEGEYKIHAVVFGSRRDFADRWKSEDCVNQHFAETLKTVTITLAHGKNDSVVNPNQLESMQVFLQGFHKNSTTDIVENRDHSWAFWDSRLADIFDRFEKEQAGK